jgi:DNA-binding GntR family transcriptional regulator
VASIKTEKSVQAALIGHRRIVQKLKDKDIQGLEEALSEHFRHIVIHDL